MDTILFGDVVALVIEHLSVELSKPVRSQVPNPRPDAFVTVRRVGGPRETMVSDNALVTIEAWAASDEDAHDLCQLARAHTYAMRGEVVSGVQVYRVVEVGGPVQLPDPVSGQPRYTFTVQISYRGSTV